MDRIDGMDLFAGGRWFRSQGECMEFSEKHIPEVQFQWFIDIVSYLQFVKGETVSNLESQRNELHMSWVRKMKKQSIIISAFKTYLPTNIGGLGEEK